MATLPASIIRRYGVSKKAWQVFRGTKNSKKSKRSNTMARKKKGGFKGKSSGLSPMELGIGSAIYGYARQPIANIVPDIPNVPYSDNVVLGAAGFLAAWKGKGMIKKAGMVVLANEAFIAASRMSAGQQSSSSQIDNTY